MYDSFLAVLGIVLIPVLVWWCRMSLPANTKLLGFLFIIMFGTGSLELAGFNATIIRYMFEIPVVLLFLYQLFFHKAKSLPGAACMIFFIIVSFVSVYQTSFVMWFLFLTTFLEVIMLFYCFLNLNMAKKEEDALNRLFIYLCASQMVASVLKYFLIGICEPYIGSMASHSGGLTTLFSLAGFCMAFCIYHYTHDVKALWMILGFIVFGIVGEKRALVFMIPVFYFISLFICSYIVKQYNGFLRKLCLGMVLMPCLFYVMCRLHPSFNPEKQVWGSFDLEYALEYADNYSSGDMFADQDDDIGRSKAISIFHDKILEDDFFHAIFGYGSGLLVQSKYNKVCNDVPEYALRRWGIGYSMSIGYLTILAQVGFAGTVIYFLIYFYILFFIYKKIQYNIHLLTVREAGYALAAIMCLIAMIFLSMIYNTSAFNLNPVSAAAMWFCAYAVRLIDGKRKI